MTDYTYRVYYSESNSYWWRFYKEVIGKDRAISVAKRLAHRTHRATKVSHAATSVTVWESYNPDFVLRRRL
jgi:hypothetical protein